MGFSVWLFLTTKRNHLLTFKKLIFRICPNKNQSHRIFPNSTHLPRKTLTSGGPRPPFPLLFPAERASGLQRLQKTVHDAFLSLRRIHVDQRFLSRFALLPLFLGFLSSQLGLPVLLFYLSFSLVVLLRFLWGKGRLAQDGGRFCKRWICTYEKAVLEGFQVREELLEGVLLLIEHIVFWEVRVKRLHLFQHVL